jgi:20S proteasome alpha/beta subunit
MMMLCRSSGRLTAATRLILLASLLALAACAASKNGASFSPVRELGPSLAASVAGGTVIAVRSSVGLVGQDKNDGVACKDISLDDSIAKSYDDEDECIVLLLRSPNDSSESNGGKSNRGDAGRNLTVASIYGSDDGNNNNHNYNPDGLAFLPNGPVGQPFLSNRNNNLRVLHADSGLIMAATGFASDAEHLINVAAGRVLSRISIYDAPTSSSLTSGKSVDPHRLVREDVSSMMIDSAMSDGGRPWGVQLLVIGQSALSRNRLLDMYTIDPSGGWRHRHGTIAAIGRGAERISVSSSSMLEEDLTKYRTNSSGWRRALYVAMNAAITTFEKSEDNSNVDVLNNPTEKYSAVVIFGNCSGRRTSRCAAVCPSVIEECYKRAIFPERQEEELAT